MVNLQMKDQVPAIFSKSGFKVYVYDSHPAVFETYIERVKLFLEELKNLFPTLQIFLIFF